MLLLFFVYGVLGVSLFRRNDPFHFGDLITAQMTLFRMATGEDFSNIIYIAALGCDSYKEYDFLPVECDSPDPQPAVAMLFFVTFQVAANIVGLGLVIGVLVSSVAEAQELLEQEIREEEAENQQKLRKLLGLADDANQGQIKQKLDEKMTGKLESISSGLNDALILLDSMYDAHQEIETSTMILSAISGQGADALQHAAEDSGMQASQKTQAIMHTISKAVTAQGAREQASHQSDGAAGSYLPTSADAPRPTVGAGIAGAAAAAVRLRAIRSGLGSQKLGAGAAGDSAIARTAALHEHEEASQLKRNSSGLWGAVRGVWGAVSNGFNSQNRVVPGVEGGSPGAIEGGVAAGAGAGSSSGAESPQPAAADAAAP